VVNLGGFINITLLDGNTVVGGRDLCVGNQLLDRLARMLLGKPYDLDGSVAGSGQADAQACTELGVTLRSQDRGRSLGTGDELLPWVERWGESLTPADVLASACQGLAGAISSKLLAEIPRPEAVVIAGGGCHNTALVQALDKFLAPVVLKRSEDYGIPTSHREAVAMAVLGDYCQRRIPITLPIVTGVGTAPVAGVWAYP
jgi:anhydro-N-acetylmuramic acid kinase